MRKIKFIGLSILVSIFFLISCEDNYDLNGRRFYPLIERLYVNDYYMDYEINYKYDGKDRLIKLIKDQLSVHEANIEYVRDGIVKVTNPNLSDFDGIDTLFYNSKGEIEKIAHYGTEWEWIGGGSSKEKGIKDFHLVSTIIYQYNDQGFISKTTKYNYEKRITSWSLYVYDNIGNVINHKYYYKDPWNPDENFICNETKYEYDSMNNGACSLILPNLTGIISKNNVIREIEIIDDSEPVITEFSYIYNDEGYPLECKYIKNGIPYKKVIEYGIQGRI